MFQMLFPMVLLLFSCAHEALPVVEVAAAPQREVKLYWFIPDGMRAEPELFDIYAWAREGRLPNIAHMMENGAYGFAKPVYPGHTPVNFASLLTGAYPEVHGVADGPMHTEGHALTRPSVAGFRSTAKKVAPIWSTLEDAGRTVAIVSVPGSTPPELSTGYTLVGRWGGWGANFHAVNFQELGDGSVRYQQGRHARLFFFGPPLAAFPTAQSVDEAPPGFTSHAPVKRVELEAWGARVLAYLGDSVDDGETAYDSVYFTDEQGALLVELSSGQWSGWLDTVLTWDDIQVQTQFRIKLIKLQPDGWFRIRFLFNTMNETVTRPSFVASEVNQNVGPMVDFVDNFPPQLIYYPEDKDTFIEEARMSLDWHRDLSDWFLGHYRPDIFIHDIYTPNQMLTSRWWLGYIDPDCPRYAEKTDAEREQLWAEVHEMYERLDAILGVYLAHADEDTLVVLSSDHGAAPLHSWVHLNNLFARQGWLKYELQPETGELQIDWQASKVVYLKFGNVYIHPDGLHGEDGTWRRASGEVNGTNVGPRRPPPRAAKSRASSLGRGGRL